MGKRHNKAFGKLFHSLNATHLLLQQWQLHNMEILKRQIREKIQGNIEYDLIQICNLVEVLGLNPDPG